MPGKWRVNSVMSSFTQGCVVPGWARLWKNVAFTGNVNKFYRRALCGDRGKKGPACYRPAYDFPKPAPAKVEDEDAIEDIEEELETTTTDKLW